MDKHPDFATLLGQARGTDEMSSRSALGELIARSAAPLSVLLTHVERLIGAAASDPVLRRVAELAPGGTLSSDEAQRLFGPYLSAMDQLVDQLDRWSAR